MTTTCSHKVYIFRHFDIDYDDNEDLLSWDMEKVCWDCGKLLEDKYGNTVS